MSASGAKYFPYVEDAKKLQENPRERIAVNPGPAEWLERYFGKTKDYDGIWHFINQAMGEILAIARPRYSYQEKESGYTGKDRESIYNFLRDIEHAVLRVFAGTWRSLIPGSLGVRYRITEQDEVMIETRLNYLRQLEYENVLYQELKVKYEELQKQL